PRNCSGWPTSWARWNRASEPTWCWSRATRWTSPLSTSGSARCTWTAGWSPARPGRVRVRYRARSTSDERSSAGHSSVGWSQVRGSRISRDITAGHTATVAVVAAGPGGRSALVRPRPAAWPRWVTTCRRPRPRWSRPAGGPDRQLADGLRVAVDLDQAGHRGHRQHHDDHAERQLDAELWCPVHPAGGQRLADQLDPDEPEDARQALVQVDQPVEQATDQEVELAQPQQGEHVRGEDQVRLLGQAEDRRDRVQREQHVGGADRDHHDQHRGDHPAAA